MHFCNRNGWLYVIFHVTQMLLMFRTNIFKSLLIIIYSVFGDVNEMIATTMERKGRNYGKHQSHLMVIWRFLDLFIASRNISICNCCNTFNNTAKNDMMETSLFYTYGLSLVKCRKYQAYNQLCNLELQNYCITHSRYIQCNDCPSI